MRVLGIDPGTATTGFGVVSERDGRLVALDFGTIRTGAGVPLARRLLDIYTELMGIIRRYEPEVVAVEEIFFSRNVRTAFSVSHARGIVLLAAAAAGVEVAEYTPPQVKQAVAGYGGADKGQMQSMIKMLLGLKEKPRPDDVADALAVAVCCLHSFRLERLTGGRRI